MKDLFERPEKIQTMEAGKKGTFTVKDVNENCIRFNTLIGRIAALRGSLYVLGREMERARDPEDVLAVLEKWEKRYGSDMPLSGLTFVVEAANTPSGKTAFETLTRLAARTYLLNEDIAEVEGEHRADPSIDENLGGLRVEIESCRADGGVAFDLDGDRGRIEVPVFRGSEVSFEGLSPANIIGVLLPYLMKEWGYNPEEIGKKIGTIKGIKRMS